MSAFVGGGMQQGWSVYEIDAARDEQKIHLHSVVGRRLC